MLTLYMIVCAIMTFAIGETTNSPDIRGYSFIFIMLILPAVMEDSKHGNS